MAAVILYELEEYYYDIPFFMIKDFPTNTQQLIDHVKYFPKCMTQPNKLYQQHYKKFAPNVVL